MQQTKCTTKCICKGTSVVASSIASLIQIPLFVDATLCFCPLRNMSMSLSSLLFSHTCQKKQLFQQKVIGLKLPLASLWHAKGTVLAHDVFFFPSWWNLIGKRFLGAIHSWCSSCFAGVISLGLSTIVSPAGFHHRQNCRINKQGGMNEKKTKGCYREFLLSGFFLSFFLLQLAEQCFNWKCMKLALWSWWGVFFFVISFQIMERMQLEGFILIG